MQVPRTADWPAFNLASYWSAWHTSATLCAAAATLDHHTLRTADKAIGRACEGLRSQASTSQATNPTTIKSVCYFNDGIAGGSYFTIDIFEDGDYLNDGNEEDCYFNEDQGVEALKMLQRFAGDQGPALPR